MAADSAPRPATEPIPMAVSSNGDQAIARRQSISGDEGREAKTVEGNHRLWPEGVRLTLRYDQGTIVIEGLPSDYPLGLPGAAIDPRTNLPRAEGMFYRAIVETLRARGIPYDDRARGYDGTISWPLQTDREPFPHQREGVEAWWANQGRGLIVLPTGTGKTFVAQLAIQKAKRPALVVTPTLDLMNQWYDEMTLAFGTEIGLLGGGYNEIRPLTVTTYDSAYLNMERIGHKFGLIVFDECHHLPGPTYALAARCAIAPFRLGLTATPERNDQAHERYETLIGPVVYRREITQLKGQFLAEYRVETLYVNLSDEERERYEAAREHYRTFLTDHGIDMRRPDGWSRFLQTAHRTAEGREAYASYRLQREIALAAPAKIQLLRRLLDRHNGDRVLIFTHDNATVYQIAREFLVPVITHQTKTKERHEVLTKFRQGVYPVLATSRVLNEGVNVPEANVGIVLSGTGTVREHVQRLGRILRKAADKEAILYEVVTRGTVEEFTSNRRRQHSAFGHTGPG
ncbi:type III restriction protein res subunit [Isosphaera pallida ATCC 43644]|uniref:Type III restriction protein res subunit n=1 Tax=Isosphaera pallida (strain ATCC 43644 / DSM 9630 / IS1B) TaxID=575540 RepID=E8QWR9_ISOPI|nr:DEAD/DEAH box helicase family protein [Isosphaera pallida]ADV62969.1 type III restriction protein res subunit [Isosphaera pallida ATCC 43644]